MNNKQRYHKPALTEPAVFDRREGGADPALVAEAARASAHAVLSRGRANQDPLISRRLIELTECEGIDAVAELWSQAPAHSLAGSLWRIYSLRAAVRLNPQRIREYYELGTTGSAATVIAGAADPPTASEMLQLADAILSGVYNGELDVALDRAGAFCRVLAQGQARWADTAPAAEAQSLTHGATQLITTAEELETNARAERTEKLD